MIRYYAGQCRMPLLPPRISHLFSWSCLVRKGSFCWCNFSHMNISEHHRSPAKGPLEFLL